MAENLDDLIAQARDKVSAIISRPKMTEKLLAKPPFRFLHDTVSAITAATGFANGLYNEGELDSAAITEKNAKMAYLDKIFACVGICKGAQLAVRSLKVVQGLEPEFTCQFLIALAECSTDQNLDFGEAVQRTLAGEEPGSRSPPYKKGAANVAESKESESRSRQSKPQDERKPAQEDRKPVEEKRSNFDERREIEIENMVLAPERGKSRGGTRGGKPNQATADTGLSGLNSSMAPKLDAEIEKCDGSEAMTQQLLGELITRPKLTEKLLQKPPFRFLHDIVMEVVKATGFGRGLYTDFETDSANVADKNQKMVFLEKIIKLVGVQLNTLVEARPNRIVAGLDPQNTNAFLQLLAVAAKHMPESTNAVRTVLEQFGDGSAPQESKSTNDNPPESKNEERRQPPPMQSSPPPQQQQQAPIQQAPVYSEPKETFQQSRMNEDRKDSMPDEKLQSVDINVGGDDAESKRSARPTTARRRPPKVKDGAQEVQSKDIAPAPKKASGIIVDGARDDDDDEIVDETRLADDLKSDSKSEDVGTNQSKLVQDIKSRQLEQEAAGRQQKTEPAEETKIINEANNNAGGSGIRLGKLRKTGLEKKTAGNASVAMTFAEGDLEKIRLSIQSMVAQTGPLGTCMDFIQEDITLMNAELSKWQQECTKYEQDYEEAKRKTKEVLHPLKVELADLDDQINEQIAKISSAKATNAKNDEKIQNLLKLMANA